MSKRLAQQSLTVSWPHFLDMTTVLPLKQAIIKAPIRQRLRVAERYADDNPSESAFTWIELHEEELVIRDHQAPALPLEPRFLTGVFDRYAVTLDKWGDFTARIVLPNGGQLLHMLFVPEFDVVPKDYLVWVSPIEQSETARVELCVHLVPPLLHLARAAARAGQQ
jgi:hypothetical protein